MLLGVHKVCVVVVGGGGGVCVGVCGDVGVGGVVVVCSFLQCFACLHSSCERRAPNKGRI